MEASAPYLRPVCCATPFLERPATWAVFCFDFGVDSTSADFISNSLSGRLPRTDLATFCPCLARAEAFHQACRRVRQWPSVPPASSLEEARRYSDPAQAHHEFRRQSDLRCHRANAAQHSSKAERR